MRSTAAALAALLCLALPLSAQAGESCPYSKQESVEASTQAPAAEAAQAHAHAHACGGTCPHAAAMAKAGGTCACAAKAAAEAQASKAPIDPAQSVAATAPTSAVTD